MRLPRGVYPFDSAQDNKKQRARNDRQDLPTLCRVSFHVNSGAIRAQYLFQNLFPSVP